MKLINYSLYRTMEIEFKLDIDERLFKLKEDFCLYLDIIINLENESYTYKKIKIDKTSIKRLIKHINDYLNKNIGEIDFSPTEEHFWLFQKKYKLSENDMENLIKRMEESGVNKDSVKELRNHLYTTKLVLLIDKDYADRHGNSTFTGKAYIVEVTKENLKKFVDELEFTYETLIRNMFNMA